MRSAELISKGIWVLLLWGISFLLFVFALGLVPQENLESLVFILYDSPKLRWGLGAAAAVAFFAGIVLLRWAVERNRRQRTIAFRNPDGDVTVSLEAIEDFVKRLGSEQEGVWELRALASADREGILIELRTSLWSPCQIPEMTQRLQNIIRGHVHDMLGVEGPVTVRVHVEKVMRPPKQERAEGIVLSAQEEHTELRD